MRLECWGFALSMLTLVLFVIGLVLLVAGAELLVKGSSQLAATLGISPLVIGLTVVSYGTSAPELAVSLQSSFTGQPDIALGNVVGSNIANVLLILGCAALAAPLVVSARVIWREVPIMIGASVLMLLLALDGHIGRIDGAVLFSCAIAYTAWTVIAARREGRALQEEYAQEFGDGKLHPWKIFFAIAAGFAALILGSRWLIDGAVSIARTLGVSELVIGLTVIAVGTSLPELATTVVASLRGERDIAVGNVVGSNIANILTVLGITAALSPTGIKVPAPAISFDMPLMLAVAVACLPIFLRRHRIDRWAGGVFLFYYVAYSVYLVLAATRHDLLQGFTFAMLWFVLPISIVTLLISLLRMYTSNQRPLVRD